MKNSSWAISNPKGWCCESAALKMPTNLENSAVATGMGKVSFHSSPKERQCQRMFKVPYTCIHLSLVQFSCSVVSDSLPPHGLQHARLPCPSPTSGACSNSCPSSRWCHPTISSSVFPFSSHLHLSQHLGLFQWVSSLHQVAKVLEFQLQRQSFQWIFRTDFLYFFFLFILFFFNFILFLNFT